MRSVFASWKTEILCIAMCWQQHTTQITWTFDLNVCSLHPDGHPPYRMSRMAFHENRSPNGTFYGMDNIWALVIWIDRQAHHDDVIKRKLFSALLALCEGNSQVTGEFPSQRAVPRSFDVFFDLRLNKRLSKPWRRRWFETPSRSLWRHCNATRLMIMRCCSHRADSIPVLEWHAPG